MKLWHSSSSKKSELENIQHTIKNILITIEQKENESLIFRLRSTHNRLRHHMYTKFRIGESPKCSCGTEDQTTRHILWSCSLLNDLRKQFWLQSTTEAQKLYGDLVDLHFTAAFITSSGHLFRTFECTKRFFSW